MRTYLLTGIVALLLISGSGMAQTQSPVSPTISSLGCPFYIPNAFTPNGDNINDRFVVAEGENCRVTEYYMKIFDRWGRLVYESSDPDPSKAWDGSMEGNELAKGVYIYYVQARVESLNYSNEPEIISRQGTVVLIR